MSVGLFTKAKAKAAAKPEASGNPAVVWRLEPGDPLNAAIAEALDLASQVKSMDGKIEAHKSALKSYAEESFVAEICSRGGLPDAPMSIANAAGQSVAFVVQDCTKQYAVSDKQRDEIKDLLAPRQAQELFQEETSFALNPDILALPGVLPVVEKAITAAVAKLRKSGTLTADQAEDLIEAETRRHFFPGTLSRIVEICGRNSVKIAAMFKIMGSTAKRFIKV